MDAACKEPGVTPAELQQALDLIDSDDSARRFKEGFKTGLGLAVTVSAKALLATGELDDQCDDGFDHVVRNVSSVGLKFGGESDIVVAADFGKVARGSCDIVPILRDALEKLSSVILHWSVRRLEEDKELVGQVALQFALTITMYDACRMSHCFDILVSVRSALGSGNPRQRRSWPVAP